MLYVLPSFFSLLILSFLAPLSRFPALIHASRDLSSFGHEADGQVIEVSHQLLNLLIGMIPFQRLSLENGRNRWKCLMDVMINLCLKMWNRGRKSFERLDLRDNIWVLGELQITKRNLHAHTNEYIMNDQRLLCLLVLDSINCRKGEEVICIYTSSK